MGTSRYALYGAAVGVGVYLVVILSGEPERPAGAGAGSSAPRGGPDLLSRLDAVASSLEELSASHSDLVAEFARKNPGLTSADGLRTLAHVAEELRRPIARSDISLGYAGPSSPEGAQPGPAGGPAAQPPQEPAQAPPAAPSPPPEPTPASSDAGNKAEFDRAMDFVQSASVVEVAGIVEKNPNDPRVGALRAECERIKAANNIQPLKNWGKADEDTKFLWGKYTCDVLLVPTNFKDAVTSSDAERKWVEEFPAYLTAQLGKRSPEERASRRSTDGRPVIGVGLGTTSRNMESPSTKNVPLFKHMLPSVAATADAAYEYFIYVVYDAGDAFFDQPANLQEVVRWLQAEIETPLQQRGVECQVVLLRYTNDISKPGPAFNFVMQALYDDGADYLVRVNDDTELKNGPKRTWAKAMVDTLAGFDPPNVGVVGPKCNEGATWILTHDMVHRTHLDIFPTYYPPILTDWWLDDWISAIYGKARTHKLEDVVVTHHTKTTRYAVAQHHGRLMHAEVRKGENLVKQYLTKLAAGELKPGQRMHAGEVESGLRRSQAQPADAKA